MKALVYGCVGKIELKDIPKPRIEKPTDARVKISRMTLCGTDLSILHGKTPTCKPGTTLGHEHVGVIAWARGRIVAATFLLLITTVGCAGNSEMLDLWKDPTFSSGPVKNVLVVALRQDPVRRRMWEDALTLELQASGVAATSSYQMFRDALPDTQDVIGAIQENHYDAVFVSIQLPNETLKTYVPGEVRRELVTTRSYFGTYHTHWTNVLDPAHVQTDEVSRIQTDVWSTVPPGRLVWSGTLHTLMSTDGRTVQKRVDEDIIPVLQSQGVIPKRAK